jgi:hypothetical protein
MQEDEIGEVPNSLQENLVPQPLAQSVKNSDSVPRKINQNLQPVHHHLSQ